MPVLLHGPAYSSYVRTARLALEEKGVAYELHEVDMLGGAHKAPEHLARHPWGKVPVLEHDGFSLFEAAAIARYVDEAFPGPRLQPGDVRARARMAQMIGVLDSYGYDPLVMKLVWQSIVVPLTGGTPDRGVIAAALPAAEQALDVIEALAGGGGEFLVGDAISLADCHFVPMLDYVAQTPEGRDALGRHRRLSAWWGRMERRPSVVKTRPKLGVG